MEMNPATLLWLPDDLAHLIIEHVDGFDLARLSQTCGRCLAAHADEQAWESVVRARWFDRRWLGQRRGLTRAASAVSGVETLGVLTWAAAIVRVAVPDCYYEGDFLERAVELRVPFVETGSPRHAPARAGLLETGSAAPQLLTMPFVGPEHVHRWYTELPGGCVVLATGL
ncbi:hypothetical protein JL721_7192 [Aureococcus anophagefferens]|nr:hypothetical protein JL721_7192 [Aureococcus anophagefferens]